MIATVCSKPLKWQDQPKRKQKALLFLFGLVKFFDRNGSKTKIIISLKLIAGEKKKRNVTWTDSKAALIELVYALHSRGSVNFGNITVKQLVDDLEDFFNISLGNVYTSLLAMGIRKKGRTPYLDSLKQSLENKLDERDI